MRRLAALVVLVCAPWPAAAMASTPAVKARTHFFGAKNVDQRTGAVRRDRVLLSWFGISSLAAAIDGHVVLLDAYINNVNSATPTNPSDRYVDTSYAELGDLRPESLFIGHDHGDHGLGVAALAKEVPGLRIYGTAEHCAQAQDDLASNGFSGVRADCHSVLPAASPVGGQVVSVPAIDGVCTQVVKHLHSAFEPPNGTYPVVAPINGLPSASSLLYHGPGPSSAEPVVDDATGLRTAGDEGGSLLWQFSVGRFTLTWNDTSGPLWVDHPDVYDLFRHRLWPTSVEANAILGFDAPLNGWVDPALYVRSVQPKVMVPLHHDLVYSYDTSRPFAAQFRAQEAAVGIPPDEQPRLDWITDPGDYLRPIAYDPASAQWRSQHSDGRPASPCAQTAAAALGLPRRAAGRVLAFRVRAPQGVELSSVRVLAGGRTVRALSGAALTQPVRLRLRARRVTVTLLATTATGRELRQTRTYRR